MLNAAAVVLLIACFGGAQAMALDHKGICDNGPRSLMRLSDKELADRISFLQVLNVKWVRLDFDWSEIEPAPKVKKLDGYDRAVKALTAANIEVLGVIDYTPPWANGGHTSRFYPPVDATAFASFAADLAARYGPMGVHAWEILNEENSGQFWAPAPNAASYAALLKATFKGIHNVDLNATVITGGLAQTGNTATSSTAIDFLQDIYRYGAGKYFDAVADHPYSSPRLPSDPSAANNWRRMFATIPNLRGVMEANGDRQKRLWITEYGAPTFGIDSYAQKIVISEAAQAEMVNESLRLVSTYSWAGPLFWYEYSDLCPMRATSSSECYYGLVRFDGSPKPAYTQYRSAPD
jgi:hypothetical protein